MSRSLEYLIISSGICNLPIPHAPGYYKKESHRGSPKMLARDFEQGSQSHTEGYTSLTSEMIYLSTSQYWCTVSDLPLFFIFINIYIIIKIKVYHKTLSQFRTNYS